MAASQVSFVYSSYIESQKLDSKCLEYLCIPQNPWFGSWSHTPAKYGKIRNLRGSLLAQCQDAPFNSWPWFPMTLLRSDSKTNLEIKDCTGERFTTLWYPEWARTQPHADQMRLKPPWKVNCSHEQSSSCCGKTRMIFISKKADGSSWMENFVDLKSSAQCLGCLSPHWQRLKILKV